VCRAAFAGVFVAKPVDGAISVRLETLDEHVLAKRNPYIRHLPHPIGKHIDFTKSFHPVLSLGFIHLINVKMAPQEPA